MNPHKIDTRAMEGAIKTISDGLRQSLNQTMGELGEQPRIVVVGALLETLVGACKANGIAPETSLALLIEMWEAHLGDNLEPCGECPACKAAEAGNGSSKIH